MCRSDYESLRKKLGSHEKKKREKSEREREREMGYRVEFMGVLGVTVWRGLFLGGGGQLQRLILFFFFFFDQN